jgi:hypothetical protein
MSSIPKRWPKSRQGVSEYPTDGSEPSQTFSKPLVKVARYVFQAHGYCAVVIRLHFFRSGEDRHRRPWHRTLNGLFRTRRVLGVRARAVAKHVQHACTPPLSYTRAALCYLWALGGCQSSPRSYAGRSRQTKRKNSRLFPATRSSVPYLARRQIVVSKVRHKDPHRQEDVTHSSWRPA